MPKRKLSPVLRCKNRLIKTPKGYKFKNKTEYKKALKSAMAKCKRNTGAKKASVQTRVKRGELIKIGKKRKK